jgi:DedD protein
VNSLLDNLDEDDERPRHSQHTGDREITLGTTMILLIFFALAVYGAALFGFGYSLGSKHSAAIIAAAPAGSTNFNAGKPAPGSPLGSSDADSIPLTDAKPVPFTRPAASTKPTPASDETGAASPAATVPAAIEESRPKPAPAVSLPVSAPIAAVPAGTPSVVVQVAAVSHAEDAELIASTLKKRGYAVNIRTEADKLLHVQVGPFANRKDADAMKARLLADGFNAYVK